MAERADVLRGLAVDGRDSAPADLCVLAADLGMLTADVLVVAGHEVPTRLLPPRRSSEAMRGFGYRVTHCDHAALASLRDFVLALPETDHVSALAGPERVEETGASTARFSRTLDGLMRNRGLTALTMPFTGLSTSTVLCMLHGRPLRLQQLKAMAGPIGWTLQDLAAVAGVPLGEFDDCSVLCRHVGEVFIAAVRLDTEQLILAGAEADRLSGRVDQGMWQPVAYGLRETCPD
ncbi:MULTISPECIES: hypothetical protein [unclassified Streptomyces]|uniref:hypothetical protein n=1 Tax=unclassified Streptomyces TaxID=2593676 RepID=UPI000DC42C7A|nr:MULTISPECIES: hypothetical protein [unclassified Streptomyces]MYT72992.1 hypothetical protein [Streptomyces sp. SID8367]RAJ73787.1 hypothetical protein K377_06869 [Streptomyces sp. PsTaAH-137]